MQIRNNGRLLFSMFQSNTSVGSSPTQGFFFPEICSYMGFFRYFNTFSMIKFNIRRTLFIFWHCKVISNPRIYLRAEIQKYFRSFLVQMKKGKKSFQNYLTFSRGALKYKFCQVLVTKNKLAVKIGHCGLSNKTNRFFPRKTSPEQNKLFLPIVLIFLSSAQ